MKHLNSYAVGQGALDNVEGWSSSIDAVSAVIWRDIGLETYEELHQIYKDRCMQTGERFYHTTVGHYSGRRYGSVFIGSDSRAYYVAVTGEASPDVFCVCEPVIQRFTRIDFQITIKLREPNPDYIEDQYNHWVMHGHPDHSPSASSLVKSKTGSTMYLGTRQNNRLFRIYDRSTWYTAPLGTYIRFEVENLRDGADREGKGLTYDENAEKRIAASVFSAFHQADIRVPVELMDTPEKYPSTKKSAKREDYLNWLKTSVLPVVAHLRAIGDGDKVDEILSIQPSLFDIKDD